jgi:hypothetical protein
LVPGRTHSLGGEGVNILEDARHCSVLYICRFFVVFTTPCFFIYLQDFPRTIPRKMTISEWGGPSMWPLKTLVSLRIRENTCCQCIAVNGLPVEPCVMSLPGYCAIMYRRALAPWPLCQEFLWGHWPPTSMSRIFCTREATAIGQNWPFYIFLSNGCTCEVISRGHWPLYLCVLGFCLPKVLFLEVTDLFTSVKDFVYLWGYCLRSLTTLSLC